MAFGVPVVFADLFSVSILTSWASKRNGKCNLGGIMEYLQFWAMKYLIEFGLFAVVVIAIMAYVILPELIKQALCKHHSGIRETMACDAVCRKCGKNLGFIGTWRENNQRPNNTTKNASVRKWFENY